MLDFEGLLKEHVTGHAPTVQVQRRITSHKSVLTKIRDLAPSKRTKFQKYITLEQEATTSFGVILPDAGTHWKDVWQEGEEEVQPLEDAARELGLELELPEQLVTRQLSSRAMREESPSGPGGDGQLGGATRDVQDG